MGSDNCIEVWLRSQLEMISCDLAAGYQFGSSLTPDQIPNDIDVVLVALDGAGAPAWLRVVQAVAQLKVHFYQTFSLPLSIMVLTPSEWIEIDGVIVRERAWLLSRPPQRRL